MKREAGRRGRYRPGINQDQNRVTEKREQLQELHKVGQIWASTVNIEKTEIMIWSWKSPDVGEIQTGLHWDWTNTTYLGLKLRYRQFQSGYEWAKRSIHTCQTTIFNICLPHTPSAPPRLCVALRASCMWSLSPGSLPRPGWSTPASPASPSSEPWSYRGRLSGRTS